LNIYTFLKCVFLPPYTDNIPSIHYEHDSINAVSLPKLYNLILDAKNPFVLGTINALEPAVLVIGLPIDLPTINALSKVAPSDE
jgi:hypothetical protein